MASNLRRGALDRAALAEKRLKSVLRTYSIATMRTLENKISDGGPTDMRIDPHVLTQVRNQLIAARVMERIMRQNAPWYLLAGADQTVIDARLHVLEPMHRSFQRLGMRIGQALEIAVFKALRMQNQMMFFGHFKDLDAHDDLTLYQKEEPPQASQLQCNAGDRSLDFVANMPAAGLAGIEVKNIREWIYPNREEVILKCCSIDAVPVLIARRIHFSTFHVLSRCGVVMHTRRIISYFRSRRRPWQTASATRKPSASTTSGSVTIPTLGSKSSSERTCPWCFRRRGQLSTNTRTC